MVCFNLHDNPLKTNCCFGQFGKAIAKEMAQPVSANIFLAPITLADASKILALMTTDICRKMAIVPLNSVDDAKDFIRGKNNGTPDRFAVYHSEYGLIGSVGYILGRDLLNHTSQGICARISYWLGEGFQRQGYGKVALKLLLAKLKEQGVTRLDADVFASNVASQKLLRSLGFLCQNQTNNTNGILAFKRQL